MIVAHNMLADNANRQYGISVDQQKKTTEKLSSGYRINRAADDAAGLAISEKLRGQIRGLDQASINADDGISFIQTAEGALNESHSLTHRIRELAVQAANDTYTYEDRVDIQLEVEQLLLEVNRISEQTEFNTLNCFTHSGALPDMLTTNDVLSVHNITVTTEYVSFGSNAKFPSVDAVAPGSTNTLTSAQQQLAAEVQQYASDAVAGLASNFPQLFAYASSDGIQIGLKLYTDSQGGTLASASMGWSQTTTQDQNGNLDVTDRMEYWMNVDLADYPAGGPYNSEELASTIAHEMTHLIMYDMTTRGMAGTNTFPKWFKEGVAQTSSGDNNWVTNRLNSGSTNADITSYLQDGTVRNYGAGYLAAMYLGYEVATSGAAPSAAGITTSNIASGLDTLLTALSRDLSDGRLTGTQALDQEINTLTNGKYTSLSDFQNKAFSSPDNDMVDFVRMLLTVRGSNGAGSLMGALSTPISSIFPGNRSYGGSYIVDPTHTSHTNIFSKNGVDPADIVPLGSADDDGELYLQIGANSMQGLFLKRFDVSAEVLFATGASPLIASDADMSDIIDVTTVAGAESAITLADNALQRVSKVRSYYGAAQNRLEHTIANADNSSENLSAAESKIRDADLADEMVRYSKNSILIQAGTAMIAQANQSKSGVLELLQ